MLERNDGRRRHLALQHLSRLRLRRARRTCTRSRSRPTRTGRAPTRASRRSARICERVVDDFGVAPKIRLGCEVQGAAWDERRQALGSRRRQGEVARAGPRLRHRAAGGAEAPGLPRAGAFEGPAFHSARWDHSVDLQRQARGGDRHRRVGDPVRALDRARRRAAARLPAHAAMGHAALRAADQRLEQPLYRTRPARSSGWCAAVSTRARAARARLRQAPADHEAARAGLAQAQRGAGSPTPSCRAARRPTTRLGCKRILPSNDWYPALARDNVELVTEGIREVRQRSS